MLHIIYSILFMNAILCMLSLELLVDDYVRVNPLGPSVSIWQQ